jgi:hypothetical protein
VRAEATAPLLELLSRHDLARRESGGRAVASLAFFVDRVHDPSWLGFTNVTSVCVRRD